MAMIGKSGSVDKSRLSKADKLALIGATMRDVGAGLRGGEVGAIENMQELLAGRQALQAEQDWRQRFGSLVGGQAVAMPAPILNNEGQDISAAFGAAGAPQVATPGRVPTMRDALPLLLSAPKGTNIAPLVSMLEAAQPKAMNVNGRVIDERDPSQIGRYYGEAPTKGAEPVMEGGREAGWRMAPGALTAIGQSTEAQELGKLRGSSMPVPTGDGGTQLMLGADWLSRQGGGQAGLGYTPPASELEANRVRAVGEAERDVARPDKINAATGQLEALDNMERLLPDVISGFGAEPRFQAARALAAIGNEKAQREVAATETFINQGRILVSGIIKSFGANPTEGERKYAEKMSGADAELNPETLKEGIRLQRERIYREMRAVQGGGSAPARAAGAAPPRNQRQTGQVYQTPRGPMKWTGTGWLPQ